MQAVEYAVIAAAGLGSRLGLGIPKCLIEVGGRPILSRLIDTLRLRTPVIHVVVGYREEMVVEYCSRHHRDVVLVRNRDYRTTNTAHSFALGARHARSKVLYLDGDLVIAPESLDRFLNVAAQHPVLVGVTKPSSENAVFVDATLESDTLQIARFSREVVTKYEWANVVSGPPDLMAGATGYVFERLAERLPLPGQALELAEVDTARDLENAKRFLSASVRSGAPPKARDLV